MGLDMSDGSTGTRLWGMGTSVCGTEKRAINNKYAGPIPDALSASGLRPAGDAASPVAVSGSWLEVFHLHPLKSVPSATALPRFLEAGAGECSGGKSSP